MLRAVQTTEAKMAEKVATAWGRRMGTLEYLVSSLGR